MMVEATPETQTVRLAIGGGAVGEWPYPAPVDRTRPDSQASRGPITYASRNGSTSTPAPIGMPTQYVHDTQPRRS
jgi:hypothetical protein